MPSFMEDRMIVSTKVSGQPKKVHDLEGTNIVTVGQLLTAKGISTDYSILVNGSPESLDYVLESGDEINLAVKNKGGFSL